MNFLKNVFLLFICSCFIMVLRNAMGQTNEQVIKATFEDYQKMTDAEKVTFKKKLTIALRADIDFIKYSELERNKEMAMITRDRSRPLTNTKPYPTTKEDKIAKLRLEGISDPEKYYQNQTDSWEQLKLVAKRYPILARLDNVSRVTVIKEATVTPPGYFVEMEKALHR